MTEDHDLGDPPIDSGSKIFINKSKDKKIRAQKPLTKIVLRRLPPMMTEESFLEQVSPIPEHDYLCFSKPDPSIGHNLFSRAYINFLNVEDIYLFRDKFDGYVFLDEKGVEYIGIVEYAPFQRIPKKKKKKDPKCNTIESDPIYQEFVESLSREQETDNQPKLEYSYPISDGSDKKAKSTPLLEYLAARKQDKRGRDERRRRENDKRKMRIERKIKDGTIKKTEDLSEDEMNTENSDSTENKSQFWSGEQRIYHKSKIKPYKIEKEVKSTINKVDKGLDWDSHFPALSTKMHNTFTLSSGKCCNKKCLHEASQKSGGDSCPKEDEVGENEIKKIKPREWEKEKPKKDDKPEKEGTVFESKTFKEQRKAITEKKKRYDDDVEEIEVKKKDTKESKEFKEQKSKKYSDTRKERVKEKDFPKPSSKIAFEKPKLPNHDDIKPFTQLPHVKTDDLSKMMDNMKFKADESKVKVRRNSMESREAAREEPMLTRQNSLDERRPSPDRSSEERERSDSTERRRAERRIRNKDRPSLVIYQPGMGRFSKQRLAKDKDPPSKVSDAEKKDT